MEQEFTIQQVAKITNLTVHTLRYYERIGLLPTVTRTSNGYRQYSTVDIEWIRFLTRLRDTGMPIRRMQQFADLRHRGSETISERRALLQEHWDEVNKHILELQKNVKAIEDKINYYCEMEVKE
ncbi:MerR family transcriptional regulator [Aneurinibacillus tyrosinisolvens]|uniref:MerR family transcriptional regulator n=1 Tax=Aneurinibacillus tyrosinisolvens TaxID=1443435 RepID=UPI00063FCC82|nr:MerR family transcriptional regulator [Aneurinibacillus tyrosinisolvens]